MLATSAGPKQSMTANARWGNPAQPCAVPGYRAPCEAQTAWKCPSGPAANSQFSAPPFVYVLPAGGGPARVTGLPGNAMYGGRQLAWSAGKNTPCRAWYLEFKPQVRCSPAQKDVPGIESARRLGASRGLAAQLAWPWLLWWHGGWVHTAGVEGVRRVARGKRAHQAMLRTSRRGSRPGSPCRSRSPWWSRAWCR